MASIKVRTHNAKDANRRPFCVGWGTGVPSVASHIVGVTELGSHTPAQSASSSLVSGKRWVSSRNARIS